MLRFRMAVAGDAALGGIAHCAAGLGDYRALWPIVEADFYAWEQAQFRTGGGGAESWKPLSARYAGWKETHFPGRLILERTGNLMRSLTDPHDPNAVLIEQPTTLTLGSRIPYAVYHQEGTSRMPGRPPIQFSDAFQRTVMDHIQTYLAQLARASFERHG